MNTDNKNNRIIHTKLYSKIAAEVLQSVEGQLSDGMWENTPAMEKYWRFSNVETAPDGEVLIVVDSSTGKYDKYCNKHIANGFYDMTDNDVIKWFAAKVKHIMQTELKDDPQYYSYCGRTKWLRTNDQFETNYLSYHEKITVSDVYFIYDFLLGRGTARKYSVAQHQKIEGEPKSESDTKAEVKRRNDIAEIEKSWCSECQKLDEWKKTQIKLIEDDYMKKIEAVNAKFKAERDKLNKI